MTYVDTRRDISVLKDVVLAAISGAEAGSEEIIFTAKDGRQWRMYHSQDCCEQVSVEEVIGDVADLIGLPILRAEETSNQEPDLGGNSCTWTFYHLATERGHVTLRWLGESNGYYSESVDFEEILPNASN